MRFLDPSRDPASWVRKVIWTLVGLVGFVAVFLAAQLAASTSWFCNDVCHTVHRDNANEWYLSTHSEVGCITCHYEVNMNAIAFTLDRADKLFDVPPTFSGEYRWPMNLYSHIAAVYPDDACEQCHALETREITTSRGIKIDHDVHKKAGINCAQCHNRVCHPETDYEIQLPGNKKKQDFTFMPACFRCHWLTQKGRPSEYLAPGTCSTCHDRAFDLTPKSHAREDWLDLKGSSKGHALAAKQTKAFAEQQAGLWAEVEDEYYARRPRLLARLAIGDDPVLVKVPPYWAIWECRNCHTERFCTNCHGVEVPHPARFTKTHSKAYTVRNVAVCARCHNRTGDPSLAATTCSQCHHRAWLPARGPWLAQHPAIAKVVDASKNCGRCHKETFCSSCHVRGRPSTPF